MVFVKVRETYDLHTVRNKMTLIAIHTPEPDIIKRNWSGLMLNHKFYRPISCDVAIACASVLPVDPLGVGVDTGDVAPEDMFNPILYKAMTNESFSLIEARIQHLSAGGITSGVTTDGKTAEANVNAATPFNDDFNVYYGLLADAHGWRHAMPQQGLVMNDLKPLVHEQLYNFGTGGVASNVSGGDSGTLKYPFNSGNTGSAQTISPVYIKGNAKPLPRMPCSVYPTSNTEVAPGFNGSNGNSQTDIPFVKCCVAGIIVPPSRLHELYYRMTVTWTIELSEVVSLIEKAGWPALQAVGDATHLINYSFESKSVDNTTGMVDTNVDINKVM